ncbi:sugar ABC transporter ATP-binding protein [Labrys wisconsinensis]|uniref:Rhamnose transport system ATP-binding protein n=1 Tax=Labrys wisconsinensis TaxID=425677 RepID=A0ABU0J489_9HYPH|nr:sugar ABC transporter ATP-binding protein [Labrys wisconsinensis]MDQ0468238.1 rhamnose transport system ATP-binding protein [Labrys wisconsinensis]
MTSGSTLSLRPEAAGPAATPARPLLALEGVSKRFPGVRALSGVHLTLHAGEVTALLGENGAGKSTIVKILTGIYQPTEGTIRIDGEVRSFAGPRDAWAAGVTAIHQETVMFDELSVAENVFMGHMPAGQGRLVDWGAMRARTRELLTRLDCDIDPDTPLKALGVAQKHLVEIARALSHDARIVIMDEPTAALSAREIDDLFRIVDQLKREGRAILFISHKFEEIFRVADRWTCLRDGEHVGEGAIADATPAELVRLMVGRSIDQVFPKRAVPIGGVALEVEGLGNATEFADISFSLRQGEILGLYGLVGAGRSEVMQALFGITRPTRGQIRVNGEALAIASPADAIRAGIAYVPEDRQVQGAVLPFGVRENLTLASLARHARASFLSRRSELADTRRLGTRLSVKAASWDQKLQELSGGNQQKVVIAKWLATNPRIIILDEPTKGIDVGSKAAVHDFMVELAGEGLAVLLISSELPEVMGMADRILVMHEGRIVREFDRAAMDAAAIVTAATGGH